MKWLREPLVHFLLIGAALFAAFSFLGKRTGNTPSQIVITPGRIEHLAATYNRVHGRPPMPEELAGLIREYIREEVYYREALALGLDKDDPVIRNRLRLKMEFVSDDIAAQTEPTDAQLQAYLQAHPDAFRIEPRLTFRQIFFEAAHAPAAAALLPQLNKAGADANLAGLGDPFLLEGKFTAVPADEIAKQFGDKFAAQLIVLPTGQWLGPIESGYGEHLVFIADRTTGRLPALAEVRDVVRREWLNARRTEATEKFYQALLKRYKVTIEQPTPVPVEKKSAAEAQR